MLNAQTSDVRAQVEALILEPMMQPLEASLGEYGGLLGGGFAQALAAMLERSRE